MMLRPSLESLLYWWDSAAAWRALLRIETDPAERLRIEREIAVSEALAEAHATGAETTALLALKKAPELSPGVVASHPPASMPATGGQEPLDPAGAAPHHGSPPGVIDVAPGEALPAASGEGADCVICWAWVSGFDPVRWLGIELAALSSRLSAGPSSTFTDLAGKTDGSLGWDDEWP